ncbi:MAG: hypothetical protein IJK52_11375 [Oscillospiraceae bacterium]|nr:hypothetical protein [Oscillospiraceae bacterium]
MAGKAQVINKNEGTKIDFRQKGYKLYFGDDDLILRCDTRQREHPVHIDICADEDGNLAMGVDGSKACYVAQVDIPGIAYVEQEVEAKTTETNPAAEAEDSTGSGTDAPEKTPEKRMERVAQPLNMEDVTVTLWSIDGLY